MTAGIDTLRLTLARATHAQWKEGAAWYPAARDFCQVIGRKYHLPVNIVAGVLAALSPRNRWYRNLADTEALIKIIREDGDPLALKSGTFKKNVEKAAKIVLEGSTDPLKGRKVRSFMDNVLFEDSTVVTVDVWARRAWGEEVHMGTQAPKDPKYALIEADYQQVAAEIGVRPYVAQATAWVVVRGAGE